MVESTERQRGYSQGYAAGKRAVERTHDRELMDFRREQFRQKVFLTALAELLPSTNWTMGGEPLKTSARYVALAWSFANEATAQAVFSATVFPANAGAPDEPR